MMKSIKFSNTTRIVAVGAAGGAVIGLAGFAAYGLLASKGIAAAWTAKSVGSQAGASWMKSLIPASVGAIAGGMTGFAVAPTILKKQTENEETQPDTQVNSSTKQDERSGAEAMSLQRIKGVGPKFAKLLHGAEIHTLEDLAQTSPEVLHDVLGSSAGKQLANLDSWISQAKALLSMPSPAKSV